MDRNKLDQQLDRRMAKLDLSLASNSDRKPLTEYDKYFFYKKIPYGDCTVLANVILCTERLNGEFKGIRLTTYGPWVLFKVVEIVSGDKSAVPIGSAVLAKWDNRLKVYTKYLEKPYPQEADVEVLAISSLVPASTREIVTGKSD